MGVRVFFFIKMFADGSKYDVGNVHQRYACASEITCGSRAGSLYHERLDAQTFADWGVDYLKFVSLPYKSASGTACGSCTHRVCTFMARRFCGTALCRRCSSCTHRACTFMARRFCGTLRTPYRCTNRGAPHHHRMIAG